MNDKRKKRPRDLSQRAKMIVDIAAGEAEREIGDAAKSSSPGARRGGSARATSLTSEQRREIAKNAAKARWRKST